MATMLLLSSNHLCDGGLLFSFMDRRHLEELFLAAREAGLSVVDLCIWDKMSGGMGSFYRSEHEPCLVFKSGKVADLADAHVLALKHLLDGGPSRAYNLGNGQGYSVFDVIAAARRVTGRDVPHDVMPRRPGDPPALVADAHRAREELGWRPRFPEIETQIEHAWRYMCRRNG